jgi:hypothetical protein
MSSQPATPEEQQGLARIRRLRLLAVGPLIAFPLAVLLGVSADLLITGGHVVIGAPLGILSVALPIVAVLAGIVCGVRYAFARCPRCHNVFLSSPGTSWRSHFLWETKACRHCGLARTSPPRS